MTEAQRHRGTEAQMGMRRTWSGARLAAACAVPLCLCASVPRLSAQETSLTIYNDGRLLVRRTWPRPVAAGTSSVSIDLGVRDFEPSSIVALDDGLRVTGTWLSVGTGPEAALRRAVGRDLVFRNQFGSGIHFQRGTVLSADPLAVRTDSGIVYTLPGTPVFPDSLVQLQPRVELAFEATRALPSLRLMYMSSGLSWNASYALLLPRGGTGQGLVSGTAQISNDGAVAIPSAEVQLLAGVVRQAGGGPRPMAMARSRDAVAGAAFVEASQEAVGGTHVYTLPGTINFVPGETRTLPLFPSGTAEVAPEFRLSGQTYGPQAMWPDAMRDLHPDINYKVRRPAQTPFGSVPLPGGVVRVFDQDSAGRPQLVGEVAIDHTPAGRDLRLTTGTAFDITAQRTQTAYERRGDRESLSSYKVDLQNAMAIPAVVVVTDQCPLRCDIVTSSVPGEQPTANTMGFRVTVPAGGSASLTYQLRSRW